MIEKILVVDDEPLMLSFLEKVLLKKGFEVLTASNGKEAFKQLRSHTFDLVISDMKMPDVTGIDILRRTKELSPSTLTMVMTAHGSIENAVEAMQMGAFHYLLKPFSMETLFTLLQKGEEHIKLVQENVYLKEQLNLSKEHALIAKSPVMLQILEEAKKVAQSQASVFIHGESGTGKEVLASALHQFSPRVKESYIRVNCAAIPDTLMESEFFGHEKGAFTGAAAKKLGRFELAHRGTLLLDEVTEIPLEMQPKLLRVLQEREFERVGGTKTVSVDVRVIATSNRDLEEAVEQKLFREDLFYRLNVIPFHLPPLRERKEDVLPLANHYIEKFAKENRKHPPRLSAQAEKKLVSYNWPGNIRELSNAMERAVVLSDGKELTESDFPMRLNET